MQIVIDIPETLKDIADKDDIKTFSHLIWQYILIVAIKSGTPLPQGHGRLADMDAAIKCIKDCEGDDAIWAISLIEWACAKRTIIEADKIEDEDNK